MFGSACLAVRRPPGPLGLAGDGPSRPPGSRSPAIGAEVIESKGANPAFLSKCVGRTLPRTARNCIAVLSSKPPTKSAEHICAGRFWGSRRTHFDLLYAKEKRPFGPLFLIRTRKRRKTRLCVFFSCWRCLARRPMAPSASPFWASYHGYQGQGKPAPQRGLGLDIRGWLPSSPPKFPSHLALCPPWVCASACGSVLPSVAHGLLQRRGLRVPHLGGQGPQDAPLCLGHFGPGAWGSLLGASVLSVLLALPAQFLPHLFPFSSPAGGRKARCLRLGAAAPACCASSPGFSLSSRALADYTGMRQGQGKRRRPWLFARISGDLDAPAGFFSAQGLTKANICATIKFRCLSRALRRSSRKGVRGAAKEVQLRLGFFFCPY